MALSRKDKDQLACRVAAGEIPDERSARALMERFLSVSGYTAAELADAIGASPTAITLFRIGRYNDNVPGVESNSSMLRCKLVNFCGPRLREYEAASVDGSGNVYRTGNYLVIRKAFYNALDRGWAYCLDGPPGTRKTFPLRALCDEVRACDASKNGRARRVAYVRCRVGIRPLNLLQRIAREFGVPANGNIDQLIRKMQFHLMGVRALVILDEAQLLNITCLETVRELIDMPPRIGLVFAGSHDLQLRFKNLGLEQFRSRIQRVIELRAGVSIDEGIEMAAGELGSVVARAELKAEVLKYRVQDPRRGHVTTCRCDECHYISARGLFNWIEQVRLGLPAQRGGAA